MRIVWTLIFGALMAYVAWWLNGTGAGPQSVDQFAGSVPSAKEPLHNTWRIWR